MPLFLARRRYYQSTGWTYQRDRKENSLSSWKSPSELSARRWASLLLTLQNKKTRYVCCLRSSLKGIFLSHSLHKYVQSKDHFFFPFPPVKAVLSCEGLEALEVQGT